MDTYEWLKLLDKATAGQGTTNKALFHTLTQTKEATLLYAVRARAPDMKAERAWERNVLPYITTEGMARACRG